MKTITELTDLFLENETAIRAELLKRGKLFIAWHKEDVLDQAERDGIELTEAQVIEVLGLMERRHDAEVGLTWNAISYYITEVTTK